MTNEIKFTQSPNYTPKKEREISLIVIHSTGDRMTLAQEIGWLTSPSARVSAHYVIDKLGEIAQVVLDKDIAWHAGKSLWNNRENVNNFSLGIELINMNNGHDEYPLVQLESCAQLCAKKIKEFPTIPFPGGIVGHKDIAPTRKTDPAGFDWPTFTNLVENYLRGNG